MVRGDGSVSESHKGQDNKTQAGHSDSWFGVEDKRLRKRIQDRLAQRARRKRLAAIDKSKGKNVSEVNTMIISQPSHAESQQGPRLQVMPLLSNSGDSVFAALFNNGTLLGLACVNCNIQRLTLSFSLTAVPQSLRPTKLQLQIPHLTLLDRFPFQKFRDNFIGFAALIDMEQFISELCTMPSFTLIPGGQSWDPLAWRIAPTFEKNWGYLFY